MCVCVSGIYIHLSDCLFATFIVFIFRTAAKLSWMVLPFRYTLYYEMDSICMYTRTHQFCCWLKAKLYNMIQFIPNELTWTVNCLSFLGRLWTLVEFFVYFSLVKSYTRLIYRDNKNSKKRDRDIKMANTL